MARAARPSSDGERYAVACSYGVLQYFQVHNATLLFLISFSTTLLLAACCVWMSMHNECNDPWRVWIGRVVT